MSFVYVVAFEDNDGWHVAGEPGTGIVYGWQVQPLAVEFAHGLEARGITALVLRRSPYEIADLLIEHDLDETAFRLIEAETLNRADAAEWSRDLATKIADRILGADG